MAMDSGSEKLTTTVDDERQEIAAMYAAVADELARYLAEKYPHGAPVEDKRSFWRKLWDTLFFTHA